MNTKEDPCGHKDTDHCHTNCIVVLISILSYFTAAASAVYGEASSALCLFVCSAIRGQETIQGYAKALHIQLQTNIVKAELFSQASFFWKR